MNNTKFFLGKPVSFKGKCQIFPPTVNQVIDNDSFYTYKKMLCLSQEEIEDIFYEQDPSLKEIPTPFEFLLGNSFNSKQYETMAIQAFNFFIKQPVTFLYECKTILVGNLQEQLTRKVKFQDMIFITENDFLDFQNLIRASLGDKAKEAPDPNEHPKVKEMKRRARYRDKIKAKEGKGIDLFSSLVSICCMGIGITPLNIGEMSYASIQTLTKKYQDKEKYDLDIRSLLAGADSKKIKPEYWISKIEE